MDTLKKIFPLSFKFVDTTSNFVIGILIYIGIAGASGILVNVLTSYIFNFLPWIIEHVVDRTIYAAGGLIDAYAVAGIVIQILVFTKAIKK